MLTCPLLIVTCFFMKGVRDPTMFWQSLKNKTKHVNIDLHYGIELGEGRLVDFRV